MPRKKRKEKSKKKISLKYIFLSKDNLTRDIIITIISILVLALLIINHRQLSIKQDLSSQSEVGNVAEYTAENPIVDSANWKSYKSQYYGFELKYPEDWSNPSLENAPNGVNWEYRYQFRKQTIDEGNPHIGFDVVVYNVNKVKELYNTDEFPTLKNPEQGISKEIRVPLVDNQNYPAAQIYIGENDEYFNPTYFYTLTRDDYIYNVVPILADGKEIFQSKKDIIENFPEFITAASAFNLVDIKRSIAIVKHVISAPMPLVYARDSLGRLVCNKGSHDHPQKSDQNKGKHLDMECCLDPDEYPNPHCYYSQTKYGKYL